MGWGALNKQAVAFASHPQSLLAPKHTELSVSRCLSYIERGSEFIRPNQDVKDDHKQMQADASSHGFHEQ